MRRRKNRGDHASHERWLVSYADFITLLFAFFVVLYASSQVDKAKMGKLATAISGAFQQLGAFQGSTAGPTGELPQGISSSSENQADRGPTRIPAGPGGVEIESAQNGFSPQDIARLKKDLENALAAEIRRRDVAIRVGPEGLIVSLREVGFFDSGSAVLRARTERTIRSIVKLLRDRGVAIRIEGHTDDVPIHTPQFSSNWELSTARATQMIRLLISKYDFPPDRLSAAGFGEFHPVASNDTADGRRQNRRVDFVILAPPARSRERHR